MKRPAPLRVAILGAGGLGREVAEAVRAAAAAGQAIACVAFAVDPGFDAPAAIGGLPVHRDIAGLAADPELRLVIALGNPAARRRAAASLAMQGVRFATVIHPAAAIGATVAIGEGTVVLGPASITADVTIGAHALLNPMVSIAHDCVLEDFATLAPAVALAGGVRVDQGAELGTGARVIPRMTIGAWSMVGAGATVIRPVPPDAVVAGVPARILSVRVAGWQDTP